jgi:DNA polymerase elongation subunit (family B)
MLGMSLKELGRAYIDPTCRQQPTSWYITVPGRQCFDLLDGFKKYYKPKGELSAYDLKSVIANKEVMEESAFSYEDYGGKINELFENRDWKTFLQYCRYDVIALNTIDKKLKLIAFYEHLRMIAGVKIEETLMNSRVIESLILHAGIKPMPTKDYTKTTTETFEGALVLSPPLGIHENVGVVDLTALYPNIMLGFNISPDKDGVILNTLKVIMEERDKLRYLKNEGKATEVEKNKETVLKFLANSFYGVIGWPRFRLYNREQASKITETGRTLNGYLQKIALEVGYEPIYGDTDSIFVKGIPDIEAGIKFQDYCNEKLSEWSDNEGSRVHFTLKFEKYYKSLMFKRAVSGEVAKKRYAGYLTWKDEPKFTPGLNFTGIELKRSDQSNITKTLLRQFLVEILVNNNIEGAISDVRKTVNSIIQGNVSIHDVSIPKGIKDATRNDPWARGMRVCKDKLGIQIAQGIKPRLIYIKGDKELCITDDIDEQLVRDKFEIDWERCMEKTIRSKMETFIESVGYTWSGAIDGQRTLI